MLNLFPVNGGMLNSNPVVISFSQEEVGGVVDNSTNTVVISNTSIPNGQGSQEEVPVIIGGGNGSGATEIAWVSLPAEGGVGGESYIWEIKVVVNGLDVSDRLVATVTVDREEGAAGTAEFSLFIVDNTVNPLDWLNNSVVISFIRKSQTGTLLNTWKRFTGYVIEPSWDAINRYLTCQCSDNRQKRVEFMSITEINELIPAPWSPDVWGTDISSLWDYADQRIQALQSSLDCDVEGNYRLTPWQSKAIPDFFFDNVIIDGSLSVDISSTINRSNYIEVEIACRYYRLWEDQVELKWRHPEAPFCNWILNSTEVPNVTNVEDVVSGAGYTIIKHTYTDIPLSNPLPMLCGLEGAWINTFSGLLLGFDVIVGKRWVQTITETYNLVLMTNEASDINKRNIVKDSYSVDLSTSKSQDWESSTDFSIDDYNGYVDTLHSSITDSLKINTDYITEAVDTSYENRGQLMFATIFGVEQAKLVNSHRATTVSWDVPTPMSASIDLVHTLKVNAYGSVAQGKCVAIKDTFDLDSGSCITNLKIAVLSGDGLDGEAITYPEQLASPEYTEMDIPLILLPTQIGGQGAVYDDTKDGWSGNYSVTTGDSFSTQLSWKGRDIPATNTDDPELSSDTTFILSVYKDPLSL